MWRVTHLITALIYGFLKFILSKKKYTTAIEFAEKGIAVLTDDKVITADEKLEINDEINDFMESIHQEMKK